MRSRGWLVTVALVPLAGCVVPVPGAPLFEARSSLPDFEVDVVRPGEITPRGSGGSLDGVSPGATALLQGWVPSPDASLVVVSEQPLEVVEQHRVLRPDAQAVVGAAVADLGFRLLLRATAGQLENGCVLARLPGDRTVVLAGSDPALCPDAA